MKQLPIGIQTFAHIIQDNCVYVDKTQAIAELIRSGRYYFLSRPRRFGKSLLLSTLKAIFAGQQALFQGLWIYDRIAWKTHPVVHLDLSLIPRDTPEHLKTGLWNFLTTVAAQHQLELRPQEYNAAFAELLVKLAEKYQTTVAVLIDEYDKPIVDHIENLPVAQQNRDILKYFYEILKGSDPYLRFVFLTGVSKFSRVSVFSGLNNLQDITLAPQFGTLLGYTQAELEHYFADYLEQFCQQEQISRETLLADIREWYNGYSWNGVDRVYNPFSILNLFAQKRFRNYWFATGTPTFLIKLIKTINIDVAEFEQKEVPEVVFESYDLPDLNVFALLLQTGYLTISRVEKKRSFLQYTLNYPNLEVKEAFLTYLFESFSNHRLDQIQTSARTLQEALQHENLEDFMNIMRGMFAKIPYTLHIPQEAYYHSLFYMIAALMGVEIDLEVLTDKGRIDGVLEFADKIYVIEFKYGKAGSAMEALTEAAIRQIQAKKYAERFRNDARPRLLLGVGFSEKELGYQLVREVG